MASCLNIKHSEIKAKVDALVAQTDGKMPVELMSAAISAYQEKYNKSDDYFPTITELRQDYFDTINSELRGSIKIITEYHRDSARASFRYAKAMMGNLVDNPSTAKTPDNRGRTVYRYTVKAPENVTVHKSISVNPTRVPNKIPEYLYKDTRQYSLWLLNQFKNDPNKIIDNEKNIISVLEQISENSVLPEFRVLAKEYLKTAKEIPFRYSTEDINKDMPGILGFFEETSRRIVVDFNTISKIYDNNFEGIGGKGNSLKLEHVILHEMTHGLTVNAYLAYPDFKASINKLYAKANAYNIFKGESFYGLTKPEEFMAEALSNPEFQKFLAKIPYEDSGSRNIWDAFVNLLLKVFRTQFDINNTNNTLLKATIKEVAKAFPHYDSKNATFLKAGMDIHSFNPESFLKSLNSNKVIKLPNKKIQDLFREDNDLAKIGSQEQYSQYLDTIFPDSKVKDIVYHFGAKLLSEFNKPNRGKGIYFTTDIDGKYVFYPNFTGIKTKESRTTALLNIKNIQHGKGNTLFKTLEDKENYYYNQSKLLELQNNTTQLRFNKASKEEINKAIQIMNSFEPKKVEYQEINIEDNLKDNDINADGLLIEKPLSGVNTDEKFLVVFEPEQIHILGNKKDIEGFKNFVNQNKPGTQTSLFSFDTELKNENPNQVNYSLKAVALITKNLAKVKAWEKQVQNPPVFWEKLQKDLGIPQAQIDLLRASKGNTIEEKLLDFAAKYSQVVEINVATTKEPYIPILKDLDYDVRDNPKRDYYEIWGDNVLVEGGFESIRDAKNRIKELQDKVTKNKEKKEKLTQIYVDLTAHGKKDPMDVEGQWGGSRPYTKRDWKYKELKIQVPNIALVSNVLKHAPFNEPSTIAHVRASFNEKTKEVIVHEFQSDPFQDNAQWTLDTEAGAKEQVYSLSKTYNDVSIKKIQENGIDKWQVKGRERKQLTAQGVEQDENEMWRSSNGNLEDKNNQFLQLLNQKDNWIAFGINSIIQQAAKQGFTSVKFPTGNTAIQIEGGSTVEELKKVKEDRIKELESSKKDLKPKILSSSYIKGVTLMRLNKSDGYLKDGYVVWTNTIKDLEDKSIVTKDTTQNIHGVDFTYVTLSKEFLENNFELTVKKQEDGINNEINQLKGELKTLETQGLSGVFGGVYNFYERTVKNVLQKSGYNPKEVTDKYGNEFNEVELNAEVKAKTQTVLFSFDKDTTQDEQLNIKLKSVLAKLGVSYDDTVEAIYNKDGKLVKGATGQAGINKDLTGNLLKFIKLVQGEAGTGVLSEETVHMVIEMLPKGGALFQGMYNQIHKFGEYQEVKNDPNYQQAYGDDDYKMRKEAMGKLVSRILVDQQYSPESVEVKKVNSWWEKVKEWFGIKITKAGDDIQAFKDLAEKILAEDITELSDENAEEGLYYNMKSEQKEALDAIMKVHNSMKRHNVDNPDGSQPWYTKLVNGVEEKVKTTVTTEKEKKFHQNFPDPDAYQLKKNKLTQRWGINIHKDLDNIVKRLNSPSSPEEINTDLPTYNMLKEYIADLTSEKNFQKGTVFLSEIKVLDKTGNMGSTIDFLAIEPDGKVSTLDWKSMVFIKAEKEEYLGMRKYKEEQYKWQMVQYAKILKSYGIKEQRFQRLMPIEIILDEDFKTKRTPIVTGIKVGALKGLVDEKLAYLNPVPIEDEPGDNPKKYSEFVAKLTAVHATLSKNKIAGYEQNKAKAIRLGKLMKAIRDIQVNGNLKMFVDFAKAELEYMENNFILKNDDIINRDLRDWKEIVNVINDIHKDFKSIFYDKKIGIDITLEMDPKIVESFNELANSESMGKVQAYISNRAKAMILEAAKDSGAGDLSKAAPETGFFMRLFGSLNLWNHPMFKTLWGLIQRSKEKTRVATQELWHQIKEKSEGLTQTDFDKIINPKTGNLIHPYNEKYYNDIEVAAAEFDYDKLESLVTIDHENLKKFIAEKKKEIENRDWAKIDPLYGGKYIKQRELSKIVKQYDIYNSPITLANLLGKDGQNFLGKFIKKVPPTEALKIKYYSNEYNAIKNNKKLLEFYEFFKEKIDEFKEHLPVDISGNFVPKLEADVLERALTDVSGPTGKDDIMSVLANQIIPETNYFMGEVDEQTGKMKNSIPLYFLKDVEHKSKDLPKLLYLFGSMANNYKNMNEIEDSVILLREVLTTSKQAVTDSQGHTVQKDFSTSLKEAVVSMDDLKSFDSFVEYYLYGKRYKEDLGHKKGTKKVKKIVDGKEVWEEVDTYRSYNGLVNNIRNWYTKVALGGNPVSGFAAGVGGTANAFFIAFKRQFFTESQLRGSLREVVQAFIEDKSGMVATKALGITRAFDLADSENTFKKANELSVIKANHYSANDTLMFMLRGADNGVTNAVLLSLLKNHTIEDNEIVRMDKVKNKALKSIYDQLESKDGKLVNLKSVLNDKQFAKLRAKTYRLMSTIVGMNGRNDMSLMRTSIFGDMVMQFKTWMPMMVHERFAGVNYDAELDAVTKGKYVAFYNVLWNKHFIPMLGETLKTVMGMENSKEFDAKLMELYKRELAENETLEGTLKFPDFKEMYIGNLRSTIYEVGFMIALSGVIVASRMAMGDDPTKKDKFMAKALTRALAEFTFFIDPRTFTSLVGSGLPIVHFVNNNLNLAKDFSKQSFGVLTGNEKIKKEAKPMKYFLQDFPLINVFERQLEISKDWMNEPVN